MRIAGEGMGSGGVLTSSAQSVVVKREWLIRLALIVVCMGFWYSPLNMVSFPLLVVAWIIDGGLRRLGRAVQLPLVQAMLLLCMLLLW